MSEDVKIVLFFLGYFVAADLTVGFAHAHSCSGFVGGDRIGCALASGVAWPAYWPAYVGARL